MEEGTAASAYRQGREQRTNGSSVAGGTDYIFQPSPPISSARRHVFHSNDRAPWITSGVGALHSDNDNVTVPEGQWRWCSVLTANREGGAHLQWAMTTLKSAASEAEKHGLIHIPALRWETPRSWNSSQPDPPPPIPSTPPELCCSPGTCPRSNVTARYSDTGSVLHQIRTSPSRI